jgi:cephalosporin hydroxylase
MTRQDVIDDFLRLFHTSWLETWANTTWLGVPSEKPATDLWIYQEIIAELRPDFVIETGTRYGGSALYMATVCEALGHGRVITVDMQELASSASCRPEHPRITYLTGSSTSPQTIEQLRRTVSGAQCVMVVLDSDHSMTHVSDELRLYRDLVTEGSYLIVEDTQFNGHPTAPDHGPGPWEAVEVFLKSAPEFSPDREREKFMLTFNPRGYLRKGTADSATGRLLTAQAELGQEQRQTEDLRRLVADLEDRLTREAADREDRLTREAADRDGLRAEISSLREQCSQAQRRVDEAAAEMETVRTSASWLLTAPLRWLRGTIKARIG